MAKKSARIDIVDLYRFLAAIMIILHHTQRLLGTPYHTPYFVEFFFMLSSYFIFNHFQKPEYTNATIEKKAKISLQYTWQRFKSFLPYIIPIVVITTGLYYFLRWQLHGGSIFNIVNQLRQTPFEFLLMPTNMMSRARMVGPLWYLAVLVFLSPIICLVAQSKRKNLFQVFAIPATWIFLLFVEPLTKAGVNGIETFLRGGGAMMMGGIIFFITEWMRTKKYRKWVKAAFTILELGTFFYAIAIGLLQIEPRWSAIPVLFFTLLICLSNQSYTSKIHCKPFNFLGAISLPLFMWHYLFIRVLLLFPAIGNLRRAVILFGGSIAISIIHYFIVSAIQKHRKGKKSLIFIN